MAVIDHCFYCFKLSWWLPVFSSNLLIWRVFHLSIVGRSILCGTHNLFEKIEKRTRENKSLFTMTMRALTHWLKLAPYQTRHPPFSPDLAPNAKTYHETSKAVIVSRAVFTEIPSKISLGSNFALLRLTLKTKVMFIFGLLIKFYMKSTPTLHIIKLPFRSASFGIYSLL